MIELGVPYSDPLADGPVIQAAATRALENGATLDKVIAMAKKAIDNGKGVKALIVMFDVFQSDLPTEAWRRSCGKSPTPERKGC